MSRPELRLVREILPLGPWDRRSLAVNVRMSGSNERSRTNLAKSHSRVARARARETGHFIVKLICQSNTTRSFTRYLAHRVFLEDGKKTRDRSEI